MAITYIKSVLFLQIDCLYILNQIQFENMLFVQYLLKAAN